MNSVSESSNDKTSAWKSCICFLTSTYIGILLHTKHFLNLLNSTLVHQIRAWYAWLDFQFLFQQYSLMTRDKRLHSRIDLTQLYFLRYRTIPLFQVLSVLQLLHTADKISTTIFVASFWIYAVVYEFYSVCFYFITCEEASSVDPDPRHWLSGK